MAHIPYLLYFPLTDFSVFSSCFSAVLPWLAFAALAVAVLLIMIRELERELRSQVEEGSVHRPLAGCNILFTPQGVSPRIGFGQPCGVR